MIAFLCLLGLAEAGGQEGKDYHSSAQNISWQDCSRYINAHRMIFIVYVDGASARIMIPSAVKPAREKTSFRCHSNIILHSVIETRMKDIEKVGRNAPCLCGSAMKFKKCCGKNMYYKHERNITSLKKRLN